jgi:DNA-binding CsgD family transcriptional regulator
MARRQATGCRERATKTIARRLGLAVGTVEVAGIYPVLGAHNRVEAVARAGGAHVQAVQLAGGGVLVGFR